MGTTNKYLRAVKTRDTRTENGALSNSTTGSELVDQFGLAGNYRGRSFEEVSKDMCAIWDENPLMALRFPFYLRMITRKVEINKNFVSDKVQMGQGARDEAFKRLLWIAREHKNDFYENIWLLPCIGRWKDIWDLMYYDRKLGLHAIDNGVMYTLLSQALGMEEHSQLVKKYMPRIRSNQKCTTEYAEISNGLAKGFALFLGCKNYRAYNKLKASIDGWQQQMCARRYDEINFSTIPGKALANLVTSKFLKNHNLVGKYMEWLDKQPVAKFNGYVFELLKKWLDNCYRKDSDVIRKTINKQFKQLVKTAKEDSTIKENVLVALDTSGSMTAPVIDGVSALMMAESLGVYFASLNEGAFHNEVMMFNNTSTPLTLHGEFCDMVHQLPLNAMGGTNFMSICHAMVKIREEHPEIPLTDYPTTILVVSDMQFNPAPREYDCRLRRYVQREYTNYEEFKARLYDAFPKEFVDSIKFVWWHCTSRCVDFPSTVEDGGCYQFSGFDGAIINMLLGMEEKVDENGVKQKPTAEELVKQSLSQEVLELVVAAA